MTLFDLNSLIFFVTFIIIFGIFLIFDAFQRNEKYAYLAYIMALLPVDFLWGVNYTEPLVVYLLLFILWIICLLRDLWGVHKKKKEINDIVLYLVLAIIIQLILSAILPVSIPTLQTNTTLWLFFYLPDIYTNTFTIESWVNPGVLISFRFAATLLIAFVIVPLIVDIKDEEVPLPLFIIIIGLFIFPFLYLSYVWLPAQTGTLTFLFSVVLFIILLMITRSGKENK